MGIDANLSETAPTSDETPKDASFSDVADGTRVTGGNSFFLGIKARRSREERLEAIRKSRASMARFSDVDVRALSEKIVEDMLPLPDMAEEVKDRPRTPSQPTTLADRILGCGEIIFIVLAAAFVLAVAAKLAGV